jgi:hypothetical protein
MLKEERSLRTRQWPVRSGLMRGASENPLLPAAPSLAQAYRTGRPKAPLVCEPTKDTGQRESTRPAIRGASKMPKLIISSRTALARRQPTLPVTVSSSATAVS